MKSSAQVPAAVDPSTIAGQQTGANITSGIGQALLNHPNIYTPTGSTTNNVTGSYDLGNGFSVPTFSQTTSLSPEQQNLLNSQQQTQGNLANAAYGASGNLGSSFAPIDFGSLPGFSGVPQLPGTQQRIDPQMFNQNAVDAVYGQATSRLDPQWQQAEDRERQRLADQGIGEGNAAYTKDMTNFNNARNDAYTSAQNTATTTGASIANALFGQELGQNNQLFNQGLQANQQGYNEALGQRQQGLSEQQLARTFPLQQLLQVMGGVPTPQTGAPNYSPTSIASPNIAGAYQVGQQGQQQQYQNEVAPTSQLNGALGGVAGSLLSSAVKYAPQVFGYSGW